MMELHVYQERSHRLADQLARLTSKSEHDIRNLEQQLEGAVKDRENWIRDQEGYRKLKAQRYKLCEMVRERHKEKLVAMEYELELLASELSRERVFSNEIAKEKKLW